jgi:hypothetical protein
VTEARPSTLSDRARQGYDRAIDVLERAVPIARGIQLTVRVYAALVALAAVTIAVILVVDDVPGTWYTWLGWVFVVGLVAGPPVILLFFASLLGEVLKLPEKLRALPDVGPAHARELGDLVRQAHAHGATVRLRTLPRDLWRLGRLVLELRDDIPTTSVALAVVRVPLLIAVALAFVAGLFEMMIASALVALMVVTRVG